MTLLLTRSQITDLLDPDTVMAGLRAGFTAPSPDVRPLRIRTDLPGPGTATALLPGVIDGIPAYTVKVNAKFPDAVPALRGLVCLHDLADGQLLAVLDSASVTAWRTGLAAALATHVLADEGSDSVSVVGAGAQARMVLRGLVRLRTVSRLTVCDTDPARAAAFAAEHEKLLGIEVETVSEPRSAAARTDIVVLATWSRSPLLAAADLRPGMHVTTLGADEPGKVELAADALRRARTVVDDVELAVSMGALGNSGLSADAAHASLGQVLGGEQAGRETSDQITVYAPVGLPWQDLALAWPVYRAAADAGSCLGVDFLA
ncbi:MULTISPECIES: ornithine cyclodeaminase family protein [unclassified Streptomyces]|uniref:ornithine cyclodeaminase family protein n=1 Tax=unclassified Streptomyces TaxID=2593676 RepID=UPI000CD4B0E3|nr:MULTISPECIES: ornithine cyclodeaminase family protein [unclassified Streptomyces]MCI4043732.1 ornithine cyclodeaminase family protein [Streptomyces sp. TRM75563]